MLRSSEFFRDVLVLMKRADDELAPDVYRRVLEDTIEALTIRWQKLAERKEPARRRGAKKRTLNSDY